jgi:protein TonB
MTLLVTHEDRICASAPGAAFGRRSGWALCSLLFHGTALAAVLIAAAGEGPQFPPPAIEVSVVAAPSPPGAAASAAEAPTDSFKAERAPRPAAAPADPVLEIAQAEDTSRAAAETTPPPPVEAESQPMAVTEPASMPERAPPPPERKPEPPEEKAAGAQPGVSDAVREPTRSAAAAPAQLAALPTGEVVDSAAAPGAGASEPPRYQAGGEANPWPRYPAAARRRGIEGEVLVRVAVGLDGRAERIAVVRSSGSALLDEAAVEALERWRFQPAQAGGQPVAATLEIPVIFRLTDPGGS